MDTWNALEWVAGIVGRLPESMASKREDSTNGLIVLYSAADGTYLGRLVVAGPIAHLDPSEPEGGYYEIVFEAADGQFHRPDDRISATTEVRV
jgi:hypothetical protein